MADDATPAKIVLSAEDKTGPAYQSAIANMKAFMAQTRQGAGDFDKFSKGASLSSQQVQGLVHSVRAFADQVLAGQSPIRALGLEVGRLSGTFGGTGKALDAILGLLTPARVAFAALAATVGAVGVAFAEGAKEAKAFADALTLSGNFAGQTAGKFDATAKQIADGSKTLTVGDTRSAGQALAATGEVGPEVFAAATEASARFSKATGKTADEVAKDFAGMAQDVAKWATDHNRSLNFITAAQLQQIKAFHDSGQEVEAQKVVYEALNERLKGLDDNLGTIDSALASAAKAWSNFWDQAKGVGKAETAEQRIAALKAQLAGTPQQTSGFEAAETAGVALSQRELSPTERQGIQAKIDNEERNQQQGVQNAFLKSQGAQTQKEGITARQRLDSLLDETKSSIALSKALKDNARDFDAAERAGVPFSDAEKKAIDDATRKKHTSKDGNKVNKADLEDSLKTIKETLDKEQANIKFSNDYLKGLYTDGEISLKTFYDEQAKEIDEGARVKTEALQKDIEATQKALKGTNDPAEKIKLQTQIKGFESGISDTEIDRERQQVTLTQDRARAFKGLADSVRDFGAQLDQANGNELEAELKRIDTTIERVKILAKQSQDASAAGSGTTPISDAQVKALQDQLTLRAQINDTQRQFALLTAQAGTAEEKLQLQALQGGKGLLETEDEIFALRSKSLALLSQTVERLKEQRDAATDPAIKQSIDEQILKYQQLAAAVDPRKLRLDAAADNIGDAIADGLEKAVVEGGKLSDILKNIGTQIAAIVTKEVVTKPIAQDISNFIKGAGGQGTGQNLIGQLFGLNRGSSGSTGAGLNTGGLTGTQRSQLFDHDTTPVGDAAASAVGDVASQAGTAAAATATTASLSALAAAATAATEALAAIAATSGASGSGSLAGLFGGGSAGGTNASDDALALFFHDGGVAGRTADMRKVPPGTFKDAPRFHEGGAVVGGDAAPAISVGEVAAVLRVGEELIGRSDPRHTDNGGELAVKRAIQNAESIAALGNAPGQITAPGLIGKAEKKVDGLAHDEVPMILKVGAEVLKQTDPRHVDQITARVRSIAASADIKSDSADAWDDAMRYHTGGIVGEKPTILKIGEEVLAQTDPRHRDNITRPNGARSSGGGVVINQMFPVGATQKTAQQAAGAAGREVSRSLARGGAS